MSVMESLSRRSGPIGLERAGCARAMARSKEAANVNGHPAARPISPDRPASGCGSSKPENAGIPPDSGSEEQSPADAELIDLVRKGDINAFGILYVRHLSSAYNLARQLTRCLADVDDYVAEAFARVLAALRAGKGPDSGFRAYLLTALRHVAYDKTRQGRKVELAEEVSEVSGVRAELVSVPFTDTAVARLDRWFAAQAYCRLPVRWQEVLWHTEIEGHKPAEVAPVLGLTPNGVSALAFRARAGLCTAYLQAQVRDSDVATSCRATVDLLGPWTRAELCTRDRSQVEAHLETCKNCRGRVRELAADNPRLVLQWGQPHARTGMRMEHRPTRTEGWRSGA